MPEQSLKQTTKKGLYWSAAGNIAQQGMRFVFSIILARLLAPSDYGVIGMLTVFMCVVQVFIDCGFSQALIAKQDRTQTDFSTEFFFNIGVGIVGYLLLFIASPFIADFYNMPILSPILKVTGLSVIINSLCVVQSAQFAIRLDFKTPAKLSVITQMTSGVVGIALAYMGWGVWALVFQSVAGGVLNAILLWIIAGWRPTIVFSKDSFRYLWNYGSKILGSSLIQQVYDNLYSLVIGKFYNSSALGLYSRADGFARLPSNIFNTVVGGVTFPILSKVSNEKDRLLEIYRRMLKASAFLGFPVFFGVSAVAAPLVHTLLNKQWDGCIVYLQILAIAVILHPLNSINLNFLKVIKRTDVLLKLEIYKRSIGLLTIFGAIPFGVKWMCVLYAIWNYYCFVINTYFVSKTIKVSFTSQLMDVVPILINSIIMYAIVFTISQLHLNAVILLMLCIVIGVSYYYISSKLFMKSIMDDTISFFIKRQ